MSIFDELNIAPTVQFKSGEDRTLTMAAMRLAREAEEAQTACSSAYGSAGALSDTFKGLFTAGADNLGYTPAVAVRDKNPKKQALIKWNSPQKGVVECKS